MAYFEFPHTRTYDSDLGWLIKHFGLISSQVETLETWAAAHKPEYEELKDKVDGLINNLVDIIAPWDSSIAYHIFSIVEYLGTNYIAIKDVPVGTMITNTEYWQPANTALEQINAIGIKVSDMEKQIIATPEQYGAVGDGVTDDTAAIQEAINENRYVVCRNNYVITGLEIPNYYSVVKFEGNLIYTGTNNNFSIKTDGFNENSTVAAWISNYSNINKCAIKITGRFCDVSVNRLSTEQENAAGIVITSDAENGITDRNILNVGVLVGSWASGIVLYAEDGANVQYNTVNARVPRGTISSFALIATDAGSYVNANYFHDCGAETGGIDIFLQTTDNDYGSDNWFEHLSFEGVTNDPTVRCYNMRYGGFTDFRYEERWNHKMNFIHCTRVALRGDTYVQYSGSFSFTDCTQMIYKGFIDVGGGTRLVDEDIATWKYISPTVESKTAIGGTNNIEGNFHRFGNIVECYMKGTGSITIASGGNVQIGTYLPRYSPENGELVCPMPDNANLYMRFNAQTIKIFNTGNSNITITLKPQIFRWFTSEVYV